MRVASLDLVRGVAVLGILAINIAGYAGPSGATLSPDFLHRASSWDEAAFALNFVLFEGKMRALFAMLFGASMALFIDQAEANGRNGEALQAVRLGWLLLFGVLHYVILWWGDILFSYAACGLVLLTMHRMPERLLAALAVTLFVLLDLEGLLGTLPASLAEEAVRLGRPTPEQAALVGQFHAYLATAARQEVAQYTGGLGQIIAIKLRDHPFWLLQGVRDGFGEYFPLMAFGLILQRRSFFAGTWRRRTMFAIALCGGALGLTATLATLAWVQPRHFPPIVMDAALRFGLVVPHLCMALGYAALLVLATPRLTRTGLGRRLAAAGQVAFSNYLGTSLVMTAIFYGWGLGLFGRFGPAGQWAFVLLGWALMLGWSAPWLRRWRRGPLEWLWRSLTERHWLPNRR